MACLYAIGLVAVFYVLYEERKFKKVIKNIPPVFRNNNKPSIKQHTNGYPGNLNHVLYPKNDKKLSRIESSYEEVIDLLVINQVGFDRRSVSSTNIKELSQHKLKRTKTSSHRITQSESCGTIEKEGITKAENVLGVDTCSLIQDVYTLNQEQSGVPDYINEPITCDEIQYEQKLSSDQDNQVEEILVVHVLNASALRSRKKRLRNFLRRVLIRCCCCGARKINK